MTTQEVYTVREFCAANRISKPTLYNWIKQGIAPRLMKVGGRTLVTREAVEEWRLRFEQNAA